MPQHYITKAERQIQAHFANGKFEVGDFQYHVDVTSNEVVRYLRDTYGYEDGDDVLNFVIGHVQRRYNDAKDHRKVHELRCYLTFLAKVQWKLRNLEKQDAERRKQDSFMGKILRFYRGGSPYLHIVAE